MAIINGDAGNNLLNGTSSNDTIKGLDGNDTLNGGLGADILDGGGGDDTVTYANATSGVKVNLVVGTEANTGEALGDIFSSIENIIGSQYSDYLAGNNSNNKIWGGAGDDTLWGYGGSTNYLYGEDGVDTLVGSAAIDIMDGGSGTDVLRFNGDTVSYQLSHAGVTASLLDQSINTGDAAGDQYLNMEDLTGSEFNDTLHGNDASLNNLMGLAGNDHIYGHGGQDIMIGGAGADMLDGGDGDDLADYETYRFSEFEHSGAPASGIAGVTASLLNPAINTFDAAGDTYVSIENLAGSLLDDTLYGNNANNVILAWPGADHLYGMGGDDVLEGMPGADFLDGGDGQDTASYASAGTLVIPSWGVYTQVGIGVTVSLLDPTKNTSDAAGDRYTSIENLIGSNFADTLQGDSNNNVILGGGGADSLDGGAGDDSFEGGDGADFIDGGSGMDLISYADSASAVSVLLSNGIHGSGSGGSATGDTFANIENIIGSAFDDILGGSDAQNRILGGLGKDTLYGGSGEDHLEGGVGDDYLDGQAGFDYADYIEASSGVVVFLGGSQYNSGEAMGDTYVSIEGLIGSAYADMLGGDDKQNTIQGGDGNDWLFGGDNMAGVNNEDYLVGGAGNDVLSGGLGNDLLDGGDGIDVASYREASEGIVLDIASPSNNYGEAAYDQLVNIENIWGTRYDDIIRGDDSVSGQIYGFEGNDILDGRGGNDVFYGGTGQDTITGGAGADDIFFLHYNTGLDKWGQPFVAEGGDTITDFTHGVDHITFSRYWFGFGNISGAAQPLTSQYCDFVTSGMTANNNKPTIFWNSANAQLLFDADGTGSDATVLIATLQQGATVTLSDIWTA